MSRKGKKDDAPEMEPAANVPDAAGAAAAVDAGAAGAGQAGETETRDATAGDEGAADAAAAGEVPGTADAAADAADDAQPEAASEAEGVSDGEEAGQGAGAEPDAAAQGQRDPDGEGTAPAGEDAADDGGRSADGDGGGAGTGQPEGSDGGAGADGADAESGEGEVEFRHEPADYELEAAAPPPQLEPPTPREIAIAAAGAAMFNVVKIIREDDWLVRSALLPSRLHHLELFAILDQSPDLPASAIARQLGKPDLPEAACEALRAAYCGMQGWVKAAEARRAPTPTPLLRKGGYEKSGRVEQAPERIYTPAEAERIRRNRANAADG